MSDLEAQLGDFVAAQTGAPAQVRELNRIPGGFSYETWSLRASWEEEGGRRDERLILRRAPRGGVLEPYDASREFRVLRALEGTPVPVPRAFWCDATGDVLGTSFYVMEFVEGDIPLPWDPSLAKQDKQAMHEAFTDVLADLHSADWSALGLDFLGVPEDQEDPASLERLLERAEEELKEDRRGRRSRVGP